MLQKANDDCTRLAAVFRRRREEVGASLDSVAKKFTGWSLPLHALATHLRASGDHYEAHETP